MTRKLFLVAAAAILLPSCDNAGRKDTTATNQVSSAADEQAIRANIARWLELVRAKDAAAIANFYTDDGALMPPNTPMVKGHDAIQRTWQGIVQEPAQLTFQTEQLTFSSSGDMALDRGTYRFGADVGKYVVVWRKVGGEWKAAADIFNSDKPATGG